MYLTVCIPGIQCLVSIHSLARALLHWTPAPQFTRHLESVPPVRTPYNTTHTQLLSHLTALGSLCFATRSPTICL